MRIKLTLLFVILTFPLYGQNFQSDTLGVYYALSLDEQLNRDCELHLSKDQKKILQERLISVYENILENFPKSYFGPYIEKQLGGIYKELHNFEKSSRYYKNVIATQKSFLWRFEFTIFCKAENGQYIHYFITENLQTLKLNSYLNLSKIELENKNYKKALILLDSSKQYTENYQNCIHEEYPHFEERVRIYDGLENYKELDNLLKERYLYYFLIPSKLNDVVYRSLIHNYSKDYIKQNILEPIQNLSLQNSLHFVELQLHFMEKEELIDLDNIYAENEDYLDLNLSQSKESYERFARRVIKDCKRSALYLKLRKYL